VLSALMIWAPTIAVAQLLISSGSLSTAARVATTRRDRAGRRLGD
jgi:hypothetical protein